MLRHATGTIILRIVGIFLVAVTFVWIIAIAHAVVTHPAWGGNLDKFDSWTAAIESVIPLVPPFAWYVWNYVVTSDEVLEKSHASRDCIILCVVCSALFGLSFETHPIGATIGVAYIVTWVVWVFSWRRYRRIVKQELG